MPNTCLVPSCKTRTSKGKKIIKKQVKQKRQFFLPTQIERRNSWIAAIGIENVPKGKSYWCCEDHFNLPKDTKNWGEYNFFAGVTLRLKDDVVPHKKLQPLRKHQKLVSPTKQQKRESPPKYLPSTSVVLHQTGAAPSKLLAIPHHPLKNEEIEEGPNLIEPKVEFINIKKEFPEKDTQNYLNGFMTLDLDDAYNRITSHSNLDKTWLKARSNNHICFFKIEEEPLPNIKFCVFLSGDLSLSVTRNNENIFEVTCRDQTKLNFPLGITNLVHLEQILEEIDWFLNVPKDETFEDILNKVSDIISPIGDKFPEKKQSIMLLKQQIGLLKSSKGRSTSDFDGAKGHRKSSRKSRRKIS